MGAFSIVGQRVPRIDGTPIVTGDAKYTVDIAMPGMLHGKILRSPFPHARILRINVEKALKLRGVITAVTGADTLGQRLGYGSLANPDEYALPVDKIRFIGEQVAAVAALDEDTAEEAVRLIEVEYEELPGVFDPHEAMAEGAPVVHDFAPNNVSNVSDFHWGNVDEAFARADYVREDTFVTQAQIHCSMEPHAAVASYVGEHLTIWSTTQGPYGLRRDLALSLGLPEGRIRVIKPYMGGGFGGKREMFASDFCAALLSVKSGRPVKIAYSREEEFIASRQRHPMYITLKTACLRDGTILAKDCTIIADGGAYKSRGPGVLAYAGVALPSLYRIPNARYRGYHVYTTKPVSGAFRGYGSLQLRFADECQLDIIAEELGIDPLDLRLRNGVETGDVTVNGHKIASCGLKECLSTVAEASGWKEKRHNKLPGRGIGIACNDYVSAFRSLYAYDSSSVLVKLNEDGSVDLFTGAADIGQGSNTTIAQIVAEVLGLTSLDRVNVNAADSKNGATDLGSYASRVTLVAGNAAKRAAEDARQQLVNALSKVWEVDPQQIAFQEGSVLCSDKELSVDLAAAIRMVLDKTGTFVVGRGYYDAPSVKVDYKTGSGNSGGAYSFGAQVAEVEVDLETGRVKVIRVASASDCGTAINPMSLEGQSEGSVVCGMGMTLLEDRIMDGGHTLNPSFLDYKVPTVLESPDVVSFAVEPNDPEGPFGAKGVCEGYQVPTAPAIANAIYDAIGVRIKDLPITPDKILEALKKQDRARIV